MAYKVAGRPLTLNGVTLQVGESVTLDEPSAKALVSMERLSEEPEQAAAPPEEQAAAPDSE